MRRVIAATIVVSLTACRGADGPVVRIHRAAGPIDVAVEVVDTPATRAQGLMYRRSLPDGTGMLFVFDAEEVQSFWMKNTLIPLDIIFIDTSMKIVGIAAETRPLSLAPITVGKPSRWVLEVPGGWSAKHGLRPGDRVDLPAPRARP
jgi:uncharacterized membrane protein (UPF0127 family)